jgi:hypothetical protein
MMHDKTGCFFLSSFSSLLVLNWYNEDTTEENETDHGKACKTSAEEK